MWAKNREIPGVIEKIQEQTPLRRWAAPEDDAPGWAQLKGAGADEVTASLEATKTYLVGWRAVLVAGAAPVRVESDRKPPKALVGTVSA